MQLPARIGKYELEKFLGGGMSHVYRARDTVIGRTVAVEDSHGARVCGSGSEGSLSPGSAHGRQYPAREHHPDLRFR